VILKVTVAVWNLSHSDRPSQKCSTRLRYVYTRTGKRTWSLPSTVIWNWRNS